jgi:hypothetical protein
MFLMLSIMRGLAPRRDDLHRTARGLDLALCFLAELVRLDRQSDPDLAGCLATVPSNATEVARIEKEISEKIEKEYQERQEKEFRKQIEKELREKKELELMNKKDRELLEKKKREEEIERKYFEEKLREKQKKRDIFFWISSILSHLSITFFKSTPFCLF